MNILGGTISSIGSALVRLDASNATCISSSKRAQSTLNGVRFLFPLISRIFFGVLKLHICQ